MYTVNRMWQKRYIEVHSELNEIMHKKKITRADIEAVEKLQNNILDCMEEILEGCKKYDIDPKLFIDLITFEIQHLLDEPLPYFDLHNHTRYIR